MTQKSRTHVFKFLTPTVDKTVNIMGLSKFINQEIQMYYLINVEHNSMAAHLTK